MNGNSHATIRAIRGPITLITIGVLFALNNFTRYGFDQTWPVILIVFGLLSLLRRGTQPTSGPPAGGPGAPGTPPPYGYPAPGGYSRSPYAGGPATTAGTPAATPGTPNAPPGGSV
jgi:hypothetical protein